MENNKSTLLIIAVLVILGGAGVFFFISSNKTADETPSTSLNTTVRDDTGEAGTKITPAENPAEVKAFTNEVYDEAVNSDKLVVLYFYANWCPICREEFPKMQSAFEKLPGDEVVGIQVNFNDSETDSDEEALADEFDVPYQHTKVFLQDGEVILKSPESWSESRYISEITSAIE